MPEFETVPFTIGTGTELCNEKKKSSWLED